MHLLPWNYAKVTETNTEQVYSSRTDWKDETMPKQVTLGLGTVVQPERTATKKSMPSLRLITLLTQMVSQNTEVS